MKLMFRTRCYFLRKLYVGTADLPLEILFIFFSSSFSSLIAVYWSKQLPIILLTVINFPFVEASDEQQITKSYFR